MAKYKTAVFGDLATCLPFRAMGVDAVVAGETEDPEAALRRMVDSGEYGAIFITEALADRLGEAIEEARYRALPSIILIPTVTGSKGEGKRAIRETMKRAAGRDIMAEDE